MNYTEHNYATSELAYKEFLRPSLLQAIKLLQIREGYKILDAGCGPGAMFPYFSRKAGKTGQVIGMDASDAHLSRAAETISRNRSVKTVQLIKADLFRELPFDDDSFDLIWLSDVLFPDDFGDQIEPTLKKLQAKLKPGGIMALFYGNWLRLSLLPGHSQLEHSISIANEKRKSANITWEPAVHPENALSWLKRTGFGSCENHYCTSSYQAPLAENIRDYIHWHLSTIYRNAVGHKTPEFKIQEALIQEFETITDKNSVNYILNNPDYVCAVHAQLTIGRRIAYNAK
jgi:SAM-dependent methyltransferase